MKSVIKKLSQGGFSGRKISVNSSNFITDRTERLAAWMNSISTHTFIFFITSSSIFAIVS